VVSVEPLPTVLADPDQLAQVFQNLIDNALKFVGAGTRPRVRISAEPAATGWRFDVTDNGIGIGPEDRARIFAMFKRLHTPDEYPGSGIGLAIVKKIVERHGGEVGVADVTTSRGSRFWFTLPGAPD
jgi:signal transduction histidine kinase